MNKLIKLNDLEYPISIAEFKARHKNVSFPTQIPFGDYGYAVVYPVAIPATTALENAVEGAPSLTNLGTYEKAYTVVDITAGMDQEQLDDLAGQLATQKLAALDSMFVTKRDGGTVVAGGDVKTDSESISTITSAASLMGRNPTETIMYKLDSVWSLLSKLEVEALQNGVWAHVKSTAQAASDHCAAINALTTPQAISDYDITVGW